MSWTANDTKNMFKVNTNNMINKFEQVFMELNKITKKNLNLSNIVVIYRNKMFELENQFSKVGINFFDNIVLRQILDKYFLNIIMESQKSIHLISQKLKLSYGMYLFDKTNDIAYKFINSNLKQYEQICSKVSDFDIKKDIIPIIEDFFRTKEYYIYVPGQFIKMYEQLKFELLQLGYDDLIISLDKKMLPIIKKQELATSKFYYQKNNLRKKLLIKKKK